MLPPATECAATTPVTAFRGELAALLARQADAGAPRHVIVLALDGVGYAVARDCWPTGEVRLRRSVFPTTTSSSWLSQLTGTAVATHGVPGVVFRLGPGDQLVNAFDSTDPSLVDPLPTIFDDAHALGYHPVAVLGDMREYRGRWRDALLRGAQLVPGHGFYPVTGAGYRRRPAHVVVSMIADAIRQALRVPGGPAGAPRLVWCYVEVDQHVHRHGYDGHTGAVLAGLDRLAQELVAEQAVVLAHADHGLVPTRHDPELAALLDALCRRYGAQLGGAGRTRWLYAAAGTAGRLADELDAALPPGIACGPAEHWFGAAATSRARPRVGDLVLCATGESFLCPPDYRYEHGSELPGEVETPLCIWQA